MLYPVQIGLKGYVWISSTIGIVSCNRFSRRESYFSEVFLNGFLLKGRPRIVKRETSAGCYVLASIKRAYNLFGVA